MWCHLADPFGYKFRSIFAMEGNMRVMAMSIIAFFVRGEDPRSVSQQAELLEEWEVSPQFELYPFAFDRN